MTLTKRPAFEWKPFSPKQLDFIENSVAPINLADGPVRSGKTISCLVRWIEFVKTAPLGGDLMLIGRTERTLYRNVVSILEQMLGPKRCRYNRGTGEFHMLGRIVYCVGAADARAEEKIRGSTLAGAYINEVTLLPEWAFKQAVARCSVEGAKIFGDMNPDSPYHYLYLEYLANEELLRDGTVRRWKFTLDDNWALAEERKQFLKSIYKGIFYKRMILGLWVAAEGAIYDMFDEAVHVVDRLPAVPIHTYLVPIDYGTSNPTVFLKIAVIREPKSRIDRAYVTGEYYYDAREVHRQKTDLEYSADLKRFLRGIVPAAVYLDPSAASLKAQLRKDRIPNIKDCDNSVLDGIRVVASFLSNDRLFFLKGAAPQSLQEITSYVWDPKAQKKGEDAPLKQNDHCMDALRYGIYSHFKRDGLPTGPVDKPPGA